MDYKDREKIDFMCDQLLHLIDMKKLWPKLLESGIYNRDDCNIPNWLTDLSNGEIIYDICSTIKTRGPDAFKNLIESLKETGHDRVAYELQTYATPRRHRSSSSGSSHKAVQTSPVHSPEAFNNPAPTTPTCSTSEPSTPNFDSNFEDEYEKLIKEFEPLKINVKIATEFKDTPEFTNIERYVMRSNPRGLVLIITNIVYTAVEDRPSAQHDEDNTNKLFQDMGFKTILHRNLTGEQIIKEVKKFSQLKELRRVDSAFVVISSHGNGMHGQQATEIQGVDYYSDQPACKSVFCTDIIDCFTAEACPNLQGKPKIFIFQTCRGDKMQRAVVSRTAKDTITSEHTESESQKTDYTMSGKPFSFSTRNYEDTLIAYSTLPGYYSCRDKYNGSWFLQLLCLVFANFACDEHVQDLFNMIDRMLSRRRTEKNECQTLWVINQGFHKHCYLNPGLFHNNNNS